MSMHSFRRVVRCSGLVKGIYSMLEARALHLCGVTASGLQAAQLADLRLRCVVIVIVIVTVQFQRAEAVRL